MILGKKEILKEIAKKRIVITPFDKSAIGPASIDLTLDNKIRVFLKNKKVIDIKENLDYKTITKLVDIKNGFILKPGDLVIGITKEKITLPNDICGWLNSRSKFARVGFMSHITAPFICPGVSNQQVLEIYNAGKETLRIHPGIKVCQLIFQKAKGAEKYNGGFKNQTLE
jgi:dCTP deaminase